MKKREYGDYIQDLLDSINDIEKFTEGMDFRLSKRYLRIWKNETKKR